MGVPLLTLKESTMFNVSKRNQARRPVGVLLGGSGRASTLTMRPRVAALLRPCLCACAPTGSGTKTCAVEA
jgi:hypothetical protein